MGRKQVEVWRTGGAVRAVAYYALATLVVTGISWAVEQEHTCRYAHRPSFYHVLIVETLAFLFGNGSLRTPWSFWFALLRRE
jgi:hypothetical protein